MHLEKEYRQMSLCDNIRTPMACRVVARALSASGPWAVGILIRRLSACTAWALPLIGIGRRGEMTFCCVIAFILLRVIALSHTLSPE